ncbi:hypothetical protein Q8W14_03680 [Photobacterium damselae subsp. piscicida]|nr:hypothetical protein [Photobacterium damselae subsp. piscicida]
MATSAIIITQYQGQQAQNLRNVPILLPSIVAVEQGEKQFQWHGRWIRFHKKNWLLIPAHSRITFVNNPHQTQFRSTQISFLIPPTAEIIQLSQQNADTVSNHLDSPEFMVVAPIDLLMVKFTFYKRSNNLIVHLFAFRKTNGFSY